MTAEKENQLNNKNERHKLRNGENCCGDDGGTGELPYLVR